MNTGVTTLPRVQRDGSGRPRSGQRPRGGGMHVESVTLQRLTVASSIGVCWMKSKTSPASNVMGSSVAAGQSTWPTQDQSEPHEQSDEHEGGPIRHGAEVLRIGERESRRIPGGSRGTPAGGRGCGLEELAADRGLALRVGGALAHGRALVLGDARLARGRRRWREHRGEAATGETAFRVARRRQARLERGRRPIVPEAVVHAALGPLRRIPAGARHARLQRTARR